MSFVSATSGPKTKQCSDQLIALCKGYVCPCAQSTAMDLGQVLCDPMIGPDV